MVTYTFRAYRGRATHRFTCPVCEKPGRVRTLTVEHTVNPFNKNEDGSVKTATEVMRSAQAEAEAAKARFAKAPLCAKCEDGLGYAGRKALRDQRWAP